MAIPFWIFDLRGDYLHLGENENTLLINPETFYLNPLRHLPLMANWFERLVEVIVATMELIISGGELIQLCRLITSEFQKEHPKLFPSLYEVHIALRELKKKCSPKIGLLLTISAESNNELVRCLRRVLGKHFACTMVIL